MKFTFDIPDFEAAADALWEYQRKHNPDIQRYCDLLGSNDRTFLPIAGFKAFEMKDGDWAPEAIFQSSGTTGQIPSRHFVRDISLYDTVSQRGFSHFFPQQPYRILALLPNYLERGNSSLVHMVKHWIDTFGLPGSGFYLYNFEQLAQSIQEAAGAREPIVIIGVAYALLDFVESFPIALPPDTIVLETGGMKGRKQEISRDQLHETLATGFSLPGIGSEYGMTELMSQAYAVQGSRFRCPPWMRVYITDLHLSSHILPPGRPGRINVVDLANVHSCAFIATDDQGIQYPDGSFDVLGRIDFAELRGCSLMYDG